MSSSGPSAQDIIAGSWSEPKTENAALIFQALDSKDGVIKYQHMLNYFIESTPDKNTMQGWSVVMLRFEGDKMNSSVQRITMRYKGTTCTPHQKQQSVVESMPVVKAEPVTVVDVEAEDHAKYLKTADMLWPSTKKWRSVRAAPSPGVKTLLSLKHKLIAAYKLKFPASVFLVEHMFPSTPHDRVRFFHWIDMDQNGTKELVYTGYRPASAGAEISVVWFAKRSGFEIRHKTLMESGILRVSPTGETFTSVAPGCCDARGDEYFFGEKSIYLLKDMDMPSKLFNTPKSFINKSETILRSAPLENNTYDKGYSEYLGEDVFGNQIQRYKANASGVILAQQKDAQGKLWNFVRMDDSSRKLLILSLYGNKTASQAGWVRDINSPHKSTVQKLSVQASAQAASEIRKGKTAAVESVTLSNDFTGINKCLAVAAGNQVRLATCPSRGGALNKSDKFPERWYPVTTNQENHFYLKHGSPDSNQCLGLSPNGGALIVGACQNYKDQVWYAEPWSGNQPRDRVHNVEAGQAYCLDVINDRLKNKVHLAECGNYSGQAWYIAP